MTLLRPLLTACLAVGIAAAAHAQAPQPAALSAKAPQPAALSAKAGQPDDSALQKAIDQRIAALQARLAISPAQMADWTAFATAMRANAASTNQLFQQRAQNAATMSAVENMKSYAAIARTYADNTEHLASAFEALYGKLSPDQQKTADTLFRQPPRQNTDDPRSSAGAKKFVASFFQRRRLASYSSLNLLHLPGRGFELPWFDPGHTFRLFAHDPFVVFLDSGGGIGARSRYSYLCIEPFAVLRDVSLDELRARMAGFPNIWPDAPVPFAGGAAGFCAYELGASLERVPRAPGGLAGVPDMQFGLYDLVFAWDHAARRMWLLCPFGDTDGRGAAALRRLSSDVVHRSVVTNLEWQPIVSRAAHMARVKRTLDYISAGDIYQANITAPFEAARPDAVHAADIFLALRAGNPAPFCAYIDCGNGCAVASVSPERFLRLDAAGRIEARPIKGTRPRGADATADAVQAEALLASGKDIAENLMIVDLLRNDISRVAAPGSVRVPTLCGLETFATVHHLVSSVEGQLRPEFGAVDLLRAAFPGGSITGAPKLRAMEIIAELEGRARGPYCGTAAWIGFDGAMDSSILIRTVTVAADRIVAQAGGGIVADSDPAAEWEELLVKLRPILRALGA